MKRSFTSVIYHSPNFCAIPLNVLPLSPSIPRCTIGPLYLLVCDWWNKASRAMCAIFRLLISTANTFRIFQTVYNSLSLFVCRIHVAFGPIIFGAYPAKNLCVTIYQTTSRISSTFTSNTGCRSWHWWRRYLQHPPRWFILHSGLGWVLVFIVTYIAVSDMLNRHSMRHLLVMRLNLLTIFWLRSWQTLWYTKFRIALKMSDISHSLCIVCLQPLLLLSGQFLYDISSSWFWYALLSLRFSLLLDNMIILCIYSNFATL